MKNRKKYLIDHDFSFLKRYIIAPSSYSIGKKKDLKLEKSVVIGVFYQIQLDLLAFFPAYTEIVRYDTGRQLFL